MCLLDVKMPTKKKRLPVYVKEERTEDEVRASPPVIPREQLGLVENLSLRQREIREHTFFFAGAHCSPVLKITGMCAHCTHTLSTKNLSTPPHLKPTYVHVASLHS